MITEFQGDYRWLSNFHPHEITYRGIKFPSTENAYQASKSTSMSHVIKCTICSPNVAKRLGRNCAMRDNWDDIKYTVMFHINLAKYKDETLRQMLMDTGDVKIVEGNYWHDNFWGDCYCPRCKGIVGENNLGKILMEIRKYEQARFW